VTRARAAAVLTLLALAVAPLTGCGGDAKLAWRSKPHLVRPGSLPRDRTLVGFIRNAGDKTANVVPKDLRVLDARGRELPSAAQFVQTFIHGVIFPDVKPRLQQPLRELYRVGYRARIRPGSAVPVTISWHTLGRRAARIDTGHGSLPVPPDSQARTSPK
jgi:hypothetical protein